MTTPSRIWNLATRRGGRRPAQTPRRARSARPTLEALEDRCVPATFTVNSAADTAAPPAGTVTLRSAITAANATAGADTINFDPALAGQTITLTAAPVPITDALTVNGLGQNSLTISGNNAFRGFLAGSAVVLITDLTVTAGNSGAAAGGGIVNSGSLTLLNVSITNSTAPGGGNRGGAVGNFGASASLTATNCTFAGNSAENGGAIFNEAGTLTLTDSTLASNVASVGGAIRNNGTAGLTGCTVTNNTGTTNGVGAGIYNQGTMTVARSTVSFNTGTGNFFGGGLDNAGSLALTASTVLGNFAGGHGGGIASGGAASLLAITNSTIANNTILDGGAGSGAGGGVEVILGALTVLNSTVTGNVDAGGYALGNAGGISYSGGISPAFTLSNTVVAQNYATGGGPPDVRGTVAGGSVNNFIGIGTAALTGITDGTAGNQIGTTAAPKDPLLGPLQNNGGTTLTRLPRSGSPLINKGNSAASAALTTDQRGSLRVVGVSVDIGAAEYQPPQVTVTLTVTPSAPTPYHRAVTLSATVAAAAAATPPNNPVTGTVTFLVNGATVLGTAPLDASGKATLTTAAQNALPAGTDQITARYDGDANYAATVSAAVAHKVVRHTTTSALFDPATATWYIRNSNSGGPPTVPAFRFGAPGWLPIFGDWDGNGTFTVGVFDPGTATFYLRNTNGPGPADITFQFGPAGVGGIAVAGDWDGDGVWSVGVFAPSRGDWNLRNENSGGLPDAGSFLYGAPGSRPVVGDWTGSGQFSQGVVEPDGTWKLKNVRSTGNPDFTFAYGAPGDQILAGDWNGDGVWTPGIVTAQGGTSVWKLRNSVSGGAPDVTPYAYGAAGWIPLTGDFGFPAAEFAAEGQGPGADAVRQADLDGLVRAALGRMQQAGVSADVLGQLAGVSAVLGPLAPGQLGEALPAQNRIVLSPDGAGHGWFVDPTPYADEEFVGGAAHPGSPAAGRADLLTVVLHELGHLTGLPDDDGSALMGGTLPEGTRRTDALNALFTPLG